MDKSRFHLQSQLDQLYTTQPRQLAFQAQTAEEFSAWQRTLRAKILELLGIAGRFLPSRVPTERLQVVDRGEYIEEKYALDVGVGVYAPMYLLIPKTPPPYKPVLAFHGHDPSVQNILGNYPNEQVAQQNRAQDGNFAQELARAGYLVCAVEQRGFGERVTDQIRAPEYPIACRHIAFEYLLEGRTMIGERCWDGMVALSYLQSRDDVVKGSIGCTGHSGGGTTTLWLSALDERITVVVPSCYLCSFKQSILAMEHCECNYVPHVLEYAEMGDLAALIAPRPLRVIAGERDPIFPIEGTREQFATLQRAYSLLNAADRCSLAIHQGDHAYHHAFSREWFDRY
jgi:dienelactone hydrolase